MLVIKSLLHSCVGLFHPRMVWIGLRPFVIVGLVWGVILWLIWEPGLAWMGDLLMNSWMTSWLTNAMTFTGMDRLRVAVAPLLLVGAAIPCIVVSLLVVMSLTTLPSVVRHVAGRPHFSHLLELGTETIFRSAWIVLATSFIALLMLLITFPIWAIPPLAALIPPVIWGWLTMKLISYDSLAIHATNRERQHILREHYGALLLMGVICGVVGALPTFFWVTSAVSLIFFPFISIFALWVYSLIFIFSALWFAHYLLEALLLYRATHSPDLKDC